MYIAQIDQVCRGQRPRSFRRLFSCCGSNVDFKSPLAYRPVAGAVLLPPLASLVLELITDFSRFTFDIIFLPDSASKLPVMPICFCLSVRNCHQFSCLIPSHVIDETAL